VKGADLEPLVWADIERFLRDPGDLLAELREEAEGQEQGRVREDERHRWEAALAERDGQRDRVLDLYQNGFINRIEFQERLGVVDEARGIVRARLVELRADEAAGEDDALPADLLAELSRRLQEGLTDAERQEIVRLLVRKITVYTNVAPEGTKIQRAVIDYRFTRGGATYTVTGSSHPQPETAAKTTPSPRGLPPK
jgi:hypothetical protein